MPRIARVVAPGVPHHVTQRGNRRQRTFFNSGDYRAYIDLLAEWCERFAVEIWAYCLMPNHIHLIAVPDTTQGLTLTLRETHRRYTLRINRREGWQGFLWQGRFFSFPMDETHLLLAARYIELNPLRAGLARRPEDYPWSSAAANMFGKKDRLVGAARIPEMVGDWQSFIGEGIEPSNAEMFRKHERSGRPLGGNGFISELEAELGRSLRKAKTGPKPGAGRQSDVSPKLAI
ncbi:MAG: transposase [Thermoleophilia bacterium]